MPPNHRPAYHFLPERYWMNDPNGLIQWQGQTHLFYQYIPNAAFRDKVVWGHAVSADQVHWQRLPVALAPTPGSADAGGCWTGSAVDNGGVPTLVYTGIDPQVVCLATSEDGLRTFTIDPASPVISGPPPALAAAAQAQFRDPYVWREAGAWHMVLGCKYAEHGGLVLRYRSPDLRYMDYTGVVLAGDPHETQPFPTGTVSECPNYFELDGQRLLIFSPLDEIRQTQYPVVYFASPQDEPFTPAAQGILAHGPSFYAPQSLRLGDGRRMMWGWLKETRSRAAQLAEGWSGAASLPMVLTWLPSGQLGMAPADELKTLRGQHWHFDTPEVGTSAIAGDCLEIEAVCQLDPGAEFGLRLRAAPGGEEQTLVLYQAAEQRLLADTRESSLSAEADHGVYDAPLSLAPGEPLRLRIFLDRSVLEVFANGRACLAVRLYPTRDDSLGLEVFSRGGVQMESLEVWQLASIW